MCDCHYEANLSPPTPFPTSLTESPFKVVLEQVSGVGPDEHHEEEEEEEEELEEGEESASRLAVLQRPLEICLKHSTISVPEGCTCPLVQPQLGVSALHEYAQWISRLPQKSDGNGEWQRGMYRLFCLGSRRCSRGTGIEGYGAEV